VDAAIESQHDVKAGAGKATLIPRVKFMAEPRDPAAKFRERATDSRDSMAYSRERATRSWERAAHSQERAAYSRERATRSWERATYSRDPAAYSRERATESRDPAGPLFPALALALSRARLAKRLRFPAFVLQ